MKLKSIAKKLKKIDGKIHKFLLKEMVIIAKIEHWQGRNLPEPRNLERKLKKVSKKLNNAHQSFQNFKAITVGIIADKIDKPKYKAIREFLISL